MIKRIFFFKKRRIMNERTKVIFPTFKFHRYSFKYLILDFKF